MHSPCLKGWPNKRAHKKGVTQNFKAWWCHNVKVNTKFVHLAYQGKDIVFRFIIEYSGLRDFGP